MFSCRDRHHSLLHPLATKRHRKNRGGICNPGACTEFHIHIRDTSPDRDVMLSGICVFWYELYSVGTHKLTIKLGLRVETDIEINTIFSLKEGNNELTCYFNKCRNKVNLLRPKNTQQIYIYHIQYFIYPKYYYMFQCMCIIYRELLHFSLCCCYNLFNFVVH